VNSKPTGSEVQLPRLVRQTTQAVLSGHGYKRYGWEWRKIGIDTMVVVWVQKSAYACAYYVNVNVIVPELIAKGLSMDRHFHHVTVRPFEAIYKDNTVLDFTLGANTDDVIAKYAKGLADQLVPLLSRMESVSGVRCLLGEFGCRLFGVEQSARKLFYSSL
jgi:hypothetical protein